MATSAVINGEMMNVVQQSIPTTGGTVNAAGGLINNILLDPAGTLAALTVNFPATPKNGDIVTISSTQIITALTLATGTIISPLTTLALGGFGEWIYSSDSSKWFRTG